MSDLRLPGISAQAQQIITPGLFLVLIYILLTSSSGSITSRLSSGMDSIAVTHAVPKTVTVIHRIEFPELDSVKILALQSSLRTLCITTCVVVSISVIAVCKYVVNPAITGRNYRENERMAKDHRKLEKRRFKNAKKGVESGDTSSEEELPKPRDDETK